MAPHATLIRFATEKIEIKIAEEFIICDHVNALEIKSNTSHRNSHTNTVVIIWASILVQIHIFYPNGSSSA